MSSLLFGLSPQPSSLHPGHMVGAEGWKNLAAPYEAHNGMI